MTIPIYSCCLFQLCVALINHVEAFVRSTCAIQRARVSSILNMNFIKILGVMLHFPFLVKLETRISSFQSDSNYFEDVLPLNEGAYISPMLNCKFFKCAINCMAIALCDAFLFNPLTSDCWILRCPLNGLKVVPNNGWMYYHRPNGKLIITKILFKIHFLILFAVETLKRYKSE